MIAYLVLFSGLLYGVFYFLYIKFPSAQKAVDQAVQFFYPIYEKYGLWAVLGVIVFLAAAVWALVDEMHQKERRKGMVRDTMK